MGRVRVQAPQDLVAGASLVAVSLFALWASSPLDAGRMSAPGPGLLPRFLASLLCAVEAPVQDVIAPPGDATARRTGGARRAVHSTSRLGAQMQPLVAPQLLHL